MKRYPPPILLLVLLTALALAQVATAASSPRPSAILGHPTQRDATAEAEAELEFEGGELEFERCESAVEELEFEEEDEEDEEDEEGLEEVADECDEEDGTAKVAPEGGPFVTAPSACQIRQAESTITTLPGSGLVRLSVRYRTWSPTAVTVGLKLKDHRGSVAIERATRHMGAEGVLHVTTKLGAAAMGRALAASAFDVSLRAPGTPAFCAGALEQHLHNLNREPPRPRSAAASRRPS
ncbi:MAG: hypothetical protein JST08_18630 [Actinobacteria bacterium]|nr:hypothetical protein [Actinomycetota bacterium]